MRAVTSVPPADTWKKARRTVTASIPQRHDRDGRPLLGRGRDRNRDLGSDRQYRAQPAQAWIAVEGVLNETRRRPVEPAPDHEIQQRALVLDAERFERHANSEAT